MITVNCPGCGQLVIKAHTNSPGIHGTSYLDPHETYIEVIVGADQMGVYTENVWGYKSHPCLFTLRNSRPEQSGEKQPGDTTK